MGFTGVGTLGRGGADLLVGAPGARVRLPRRFRLRPGAMLVGILRDIAAAAVLHCFLSIDRFPVPPLAATAAAVGYSDESHLARRRRSILS